MYSLYLTNSAPNSASDGDYMNALMILTIVNISPLFGGNNVLLDMNKCPPALLLDFVSESYEASMWPVRTISLAWCVMT